MLREKVISLLTKSIKSQLTNLQDYSLIYYKMQIADNFMKGGVFRTIDNYPNLDYLISYPDSLEFFKIYNEALLTDERFNEIEIYFDKENFKESVFTWDQEYYDFDVEDNKKLRKKRWRP